MSALPLCPICQKAKPHNNEDVLPTWARKALFENVPRDGTWELPPRIKMRVCMDCNTLMARVYEHTTAPILKPLILGASVTGLSGRHQALIGRWCIKTIILMHFIQAMELGKFHETDRLALLTMNLGGLPPEGSGVRIAKYVRRGHDDRPGEPLRGTLEGAKRLAASSYNVIGQLAIEVTSGTLEASTDFISRTQDDERFIRVWPPSVKLVDFPPAGFVTKNDLDVIRTEVAAHNVTTSVYVRSGKATKRSSSIV